MVPCTTRRHFNRDEIESVHYNSVDDDVYACFETDNLLLFSKSVEEGTVHAHQEIKMHAANPVLKVERWEAAKSAVNVLDRSHFWRK